MNIPSTLSNFNQPCECCGGELDSDSGYAPKVENRREGETYYQWLSRVCFNCGGSTESPLVVQIREFLESQIGITGAHEALLLVIRDSESTESTMEKLAEALNAYFDHDQAAELFGGVSALIGYEG